MSQQSMQNDSFQADLKLKQQQHHTLNNFLSKSPIFGATIPSNNHLNPNQQYPFGQFQNNTTSNWSLFGAPPGLQIPPQQTNQDSINTFNQQQFKLSSMFTALKNQQLSQQQFNSQQTIFPQQQENFAIHTNNLSYNSQPYQMNSPLGNPNFYVSQMDSLNTSSIQNNKSNLSVSPNGTMKLHQFLSNKAQQHQKESASNIEPSKKDQSQVFNSFIGIGDNNQILNDNLFTSPTQNLNVDLNQTSKQVQFPQQNQQYCSTQDSTQNNSSGQRSQDNDKQSIYAQQDALEDQQTNKNSIVIHQQNEDKNNIKTQNNISETKQTSVVALSEQEHVQGQFVRPQQEGLIKATNLWMAQKQIINNQNVGSSNGTNKLLKFYNQNKSILKNDREQQLQQQQRPTSQNSMEEQKYNGVEEQQEEDNNANEEISIQHQQQNLPKLLIYNDEENSIDLDSHSSLQRESNLTQSFNPNGVNTSRSNTQKQIARKLMQKRSMSLNKSNFQDTTSILNQNQNNNNNIETIPQITFKIGDQPNQIQQKTSSLNNSNSSYLRVSKHYQPNLSYNGNDELIQDTNDPILLHSQGIKKKLTEEDDDFSETKSEENQNEREIRMLKNLKSISPVQQQIKSYNPLQIPPDWVFAYYHAKSRTTTVPCPDSKNLCVCCGYVIDRTPLKYTVDTQQLNFLGSGYPLFYNFIIYCIFILFALFMISGGYNLFTNYLGNFCIADETELDSEFKKRMKILGYEFEEEEIICHRNIFHTFSLANKKDRPEFLKVQSYLNLCVSISMMIILMFFRQNQRQIDMEIDASLATPQDYTIMVKNIPQVEVNEQESGIIEVFENHCCPGKKLKVENITLIYDISEIIAKEKELEEIIKEKQLYLKGVSEVADNFIENKFSQKIKEISAEFDIKIHQIEHEIHHLEKTIPEDKTKFAGTAFVSFMTEQMKKDCLKENMSTSTWEQFIVWLNKGKKTQASDKDLMWGMNKLFVEEAPEPDDIDWEFIHIPTSKKYLQRAKCFLLKICFMALSFIAIAAIAKAQSHFIDTAYEERQKGELDEYAFSYIKSLSFVISAVIVLFNKFVLAEVFHKIADMENWSTKTKLNIAFADSLSLGLFLNSAVITYLVEIMGYKNYYGAGGFIYTESWVFLWNAVLPPLVWLINPYQMLKVRERHKQLKLAASDKCFLTQQQANSLMEDFEYVQGKRYADIMKTMWFTFLYAPCIPLGNFFSILTLVVYYYIDKYNILRRSTVNESLSKQVSLSMTENLEYIIVFFALGNVTFSIHLFNTVEWSSIIQLFLGLLYALLPMQDLNEYLFHIDDLDEEIDYNQAKILFKTDYDRLNPITKQNALKDLFKQKVNKIKVANKFLFKKVNKEAQ